MRIQTPYSHLTAHLDSVFFDETSLRYKTNQTIKDFCKNLTKVMNTGVSYNKLLSNSSKSRIRGDFSHIKKLSKKIPVAEEEVIANIEKAKSQGENLTFFTKTQSQISDDINKLQCLIKMADLLTLGLRHPDPSSVTAPDGKLITALAYLYEFIDDRKVFNYFSIHGHYQLHAPRLPQNNQVVNRVLPSAPAADDHYLMGHHSGITPGEAPPTYEQAIQQGQNQRMNAYASSHYPRPGWSMNRI
ncbi:hypothetical protein [Pantoea sp.]|uniref:hypothetical protein n=1 Tax=Pantoea sp. TaxID=69393 RepID=UPI0028B21D03|nr:hypothetical protein [Pantoea sp.]